MNGTTNANPFFIGVFDTVAALGSKLLSGALVIASAATIARVSYAQSRFFLSPFAPVFGGLAALSGLVAAIWYTVTHVQYVMTCGQPGSLCGTAS